MATFDLVDCSVRMLRVWFELMGWPVLMFKCQAWGPEAASAGQGRSGSNTKNSGSSSSLLQSLLAQCWAPALLRGTEVTGAACGILACGARTAWEQAAGWKQADLLALRVRNGLGTLGMQGEGVPKSPTWSNVLGYNICQAGCTPHVETPPEVTAGAGPKVINSLKFCHLLSGLLLVGERLG